MTALLDIRGLSVHFPGHVAVDNLDLRIAKGEMLALVGESGCGKSTTALSIMRLLPAQTKISGAITLGGKDLLRLGERQLAEVRGNDISMIFQEPMTSLNPVMSIGRQVEEALTLHLTLTRAQARARAIELLKQVKLPDPESRFDDYPHHLSGGQRQRVMIAMAIACQPDLLIADEPTTALDVTIQSQILALLDELRRELNMAVLLITHDLGVVSQWADRVAVMHNGRKLEEGPADRILLHPQHTYTQGLLHASLHLEQDAHYRQSRLAEIRYSDEQGFTLFQPPARTAETAAPASAPQPLLAVSNLTVTYESAQGDLAAVNDVSLRLHAGETLGLVGESGCGKSTLSRAIMRLEQAQSGQIVFDGQDLLALSRRRLLPWRKRIQMVFQDPYGSLNPRQSIDEILGYALAIHGIKERGERERRIMRILDDVGLPQSARRRYPHEFSGGQRQRIGIARALVLRPQLLICDEPVSALDVSVQAQIINLLVDLKAELGLTYLFISHDLAVVRYIADRVLVMNGGRIVEEGDHERIWHHPQHPYTRTLLDAVPGRQNRGQRPSAAPSFVSALS
ncbi:ABC transporter ATP-binding protein [Brenneria goodwinii]|uniref:ABC transporter ATP-binding protein n=1 Tax=Brenneria goodwinii TaxID=1109412 RepID=UPI000EF21259|nr:ABC transporter ATP-binding protein [Brenneria goodwinii]MCG8155950.1 ABC transporter ATP-binding protein [Brenneria goodwinii]MCG8161792.1 ABC transporter ATP-binding protein [Brenneria goodwinii]MCG8166409.1 ABC transporter ATP-binding protein [Brenneria goodwinii]MCG8169610.1 ABC transporter ATP-binding protein [Brenneria goodwinii]MCG8174784.1 ABC transporter ATP-binding protein [Brenneria goodwinii]